MSLHAGTKLGPYEVVSLIGAGGMGEVYKARDMRLGRDVAVKVLPASFAADPERLRRFEQEARAVASLSHPNILAVHDIGQYEQQPFMVSELLEGESLREMLQRGALPQRKAIDYAIQIAHGLAAAHGKDIAHRDLKPDNIFLTRDGRVRILDFGLAKNMQKVSRLDDGTMTAFGPATDVGAVVGTVGYMSPEQVRGGAVDTRSDIFSFGAVLYEMLTGVRAFKRDTAAETMTAILKEDPPELSLSGSAIAPALERTVRHCLEKSPEQRFQSARDLAFDLESFSTLTPAAAIGEVKALKDRRWWYALAAVALLAPAGLAAWRFAPARPAADGAQFRQLTFRRGDLDDARYTPDGQNIFYTAAFEGARSEIYTVAAKGGAGHSIGISNARLLAVSSKGELAVALLPQKQTDIFRPGNLARTFGDNGAPKPEIANVVAADFSPDGTAMAIVRYLPGEQICQVEYPFGKVLYRHRDIADLRFSPNGKYLALISHDNPYDDRGPIVILRSTGETVATSSVFESAHGLAWNGAGDEVWITSPLESGEISAFSLSGKTRIPLAVPGRLRLMDRRTDGELLVAQGMARRGIVASTQNGKVERDLSWLDFTYGRAISNDGKMILFDEESASAGYTVFVRNVDGSAAVPVGEGYSMAISPDKNWVLAQKLTLPINEVWLMPVGPGEGRRISPPNLSPQVGANFLSDGKRIVYVASEDGKRMRTWLHDLSNGSEHPITAEGTVGWMVSPDDTMLLGASDVDYPRLDDPILVPIAGGTPRRIAGLAAGDNVLGWSSDGQLYVEVTGRETGVAVTVDKLNPYTGVRKPWRDLAMPTIGGATPLQPRIAPDGASYFFDYRLTIADLYTVSGVH